MAISDRKTPEFSLEQLEHALAEIEDLYISCRTPPWILDGKTLKHLKQEGALAGDKLQFAVKRNWLQRAAADSNYTSLTLDQKLIYRNLNKKKNLEWTDDLISFTSESGVPVEIRIVDRKDPLFEHLDTAFHYNQIFPLRKPYKKGDVQPQDFYFSVPARWREQVRLYE